MTPTVSDHIDISLGTATTFLNTPESTQALKKVIRICRRDETRCEETNENYLWDKIGVEEGGGNLGGMGIRGMRSHCHGQ